MNFSHPAVTLLISLLRNQFSAQPIDTTEFEKLDPRQWNELHSLSGRQGVLAIAYDAVRDNGLLSLIPRETRMRWALSVEKIENRFARQNKTALDLAALFESWDIRMMTFKGFALSRYYPVPSHREFGDIDIYLYDGYEKANQLVEKMGIRVGYENSRHAVFTFNRVMIENHAGFAVVTNRYGRIIEDMLTEIAEEAVATDEGYRIPSPEFNFVFVMWHSARHFATSGIILRHLSDWALLSAAEREKADMKSVLKTVTESGYARFWNVQCRAASLVTGIDLENMLLSEPDERDVAMLLNRIIRDGEMDVESGNGLEITMKKTYRLLHSPSKFTLLPDNFLKDRVYHLIKRKI